MSQTKGRVFNIERYAIHDGSGIRTQVFFKGCPLRCLWCSNPEGISFRPDLMYSEALCIACRTCVQTCQQGALSLNARGLKIDRDRCGLCGECTRVCYAEALELSSYEITVDEILEQVERDRVFYEISGGGITLCGGEPLAQPPFAAELLRASKERGLDTAVETCGHYDFAALEGALPYIDFIYYDIKHMDAKAHERLTGVSNRRILENLHRLASYDVPICVRVPVVPTLNDSVENIEAIALFVQDLKQVKSAELLPYHKLGTAKYGKLGLAYPIEEVPTPEDASILELMAIFAGHGVNCSSEGV